MKKLILLILVLSLNFSLFAWDNSELSEDIQIKQYKVWAKNQTKYLQGNVLMMRDDISFKKYYNIISRRGGIVSDGLMAEIQDMGGVINEFDTFCEIVEVSKLNKNIVRIKMVAAYTNSMNDWYWVNLGNIKNKYDKSKSI